MIKKSKLLKTIDPCLKLFGLFGFPIFVPKKPDRMENFEIVLAILKFIIALGLLAWSCKVGLEEISIVYSQNDISIVSINHVANSLPVFIALCQSAVFVLKFKAIVRKLVKVDELFLNFLHVQIDYKRIGRELRIDGELTDDFMKYVKEKLNVFFLQLCFPCSFLLEALFM